MKKVGTALMFLGTLQGDVFMKDENSVPTSQKTRPVCVIKTSRLLLYRKTILVCWGSHTQFVTHYMGKMQNFICCNRWYIYLPLLFQDLFEYRLVVYIKPIITNPRSSQCALLSTEGVQWRHIQVTVLRIELRLWVTSLLRFTWLRQVSMWVKSQLGAKRKENVLTRTCAHYNMVCDWAFLSYCAAMFVHSEHAALWISQSAVNWSVIMLVPLCYVGLGVTESKAKLYVASVCTWLL